MPVRQALALAVALVIVLPWSARAPAADRPLAVGSRAPEIALSDQHGQPFKLSEALGKQRFVVVAFYVKAFTGGWDLEFARFRDDAARYTALDAEIVGISADPPERNLAWTRELKLPFRLLSDRDGRVSRAWGVWDDTWNLARRATFVVECGGTIRHVEAGGLAIETSRTLEALVKLARAR